MAAWALGAMEAVELVAVELVAVEVVLTWRLPVRWGGGGCCWLAAALAFSSPAEAKGEGWVGG